MASRASVLIAGLAVVLIGGAVYLVATERRGSDEGPKTVTPPPPPAAQPDDVTPPKAAAAPEVTLVRIIERCRLRAAAPRPPCRLVRVAGDALPARATWVAGTAAAPFLVDAADVRGYQMLRFDLDGADPLYHVVHLGVADEEVVVTYDGPHAFRGMVADESGQPVASAAVWLAGQRAMTGADGRFAVDGLPVRHGLPLVMRAAGFADSFRVVSADRGLRPQAFVMGKGGRVHVGLQRSVGGEAGQLLVLPGSGARRGDTALRHYPFFWPSIEPRPPVGDAGVWLDGLPVGVPFAVAVRSTTLLSDDTVAFRPGTESSVRLPVRPGRRLGGRVVDERGEPVAGAMVWSREAGAGAAPIPPHRTPFLLGPEAWLAGASQATTAADGGFALTVSTEAAVVLAHAPGYAVSTHGLQAGEGRGAVELPLVAQSLVEGAPEDPPAVLHLAPDQPGRIAIERGSSRDVGVAASPERPLAVPFAGPVVVDLHVRDSAGERTMRGVVVAGAVNVMLGAQ
ncbi:MAG: carboxypeptidase-like regulatory domain-containing protein [Planctomycetota bacterium]